jgi:hypothetical protein
VLREVESENRDEDQEYPKELCYWRSLPSHAFDPTRRQEIESCVRSIGSTDAEWRAAVGGDATAACALALRSRIPDRVSLRIDMTMTVLLRCAAHDADAAYVLSDLLQRMPIERRTRMRLAASWLLHAETLATRPKG